MEPAHYRHLKNFFSRKSLLNKILFSIQNDSILTKEEHFHKPEDEWQMNSFLSFFK